METIVISLGGEDYSVQYTKDEFNFINIDSVKDMYNREIDLDADSEDEILNKIYDNGSY